MEKTIQIFDKVFEKYLLKDDIQSRVVDIAKDIEDYAKDKELFFICILNGSFMFAADLFKAMNKIDIHISFVKLASYVGLQSTGKIISAIGLETSIKNKHIIVIEDIIETGKTLNYFVQSLKEQEPASIKICALLQKPVRLEHKEISADFLGFTIKERFIVGYGLDFNGKGRNLPDIYMLKES